MGATVLFDVLRTRPMGALVAGALLVGAVGWLAAGVAPVVALLRKRPLARRGAQRVLPTPAAVVCGVVLWLTPPGLVGVMFLWPIPSAPALPAPGADALLHDLLGAAGDPSATRPAEFRPDPLLDLLPRTIAVAGWRPAGHRAFVPADRLFEKIDGRDAVFLALGVRGLACEAWLREGQNRPAIDIELYEMSTPEGARAVFLKEKPAAATSVPIGSAGYAAGASVFFWKSRYYVRLIAVGPEAELREAVLALAGAIAQAAR